MQSLIDVNKISAVQKHRLVKAGVISTQFSVDENYLRLRYHYHPFAMYIHDIDSENSDESFKVSLTNEKALLTNEALKLVRIYQHNSTSFTHDFIAIPTAPVEFEKLGVFSGISDVLFDISDWPVIVWSAVADAKHGKEIYPEISPDDARVLAKYDMVKATAVVHPCGCNGAQKAKKLLEAQSERIVNDFAKSMNYNNLDWRKVVEFGAFSMLAYLKHHQNQQFFDDFLSSDGKFKTLEYIYNASTYTPPK